MVYPDGTLIRGSGPAVYLVEGGERRWITDPSTFNAWGLDWGAIRVVPPGDIEAIAVGPDLRMPAYPDGTLLHSPGRSEVFVMQRGRRRWIPDQATFDAHGFTWPAVRSVAAGELRAIPWGMDLPNQAMAFERRIIAQYAPRVHLHPDERYLPTSVPAFLRMSLLRDTSDPSYVRSPVDQYTLVCPRGGGGSALEVGATQGYYLDLPALENRYGMRLLDGTCRAPMYAHVLRAADGAFIDIQYWFCYAFNGAVWFRAGAFGDKGNFAMPPFGEHDGDWEHITVRVTPDGSRLIGAFYAYHSDTAWYPAAELALVDGTHPTVYSAVYTHGSYPRPQIPSRAELDLGPTWIKLVDVADTGPRWDPWTYEGGLIQVGVLNGTPLNGQAWIMYAGKWGPVRDFRHEPPRLSSLPDGLADLLRPLAGKIIGVIPEKDIKVTHGPDTPASQGAYSVAPWLSEANGSTEAGTPFLDFKAASRREPVASVAIRTGQRVDRVQIVTRDGEDYTHGGAGGSEQRLHLEPHEYIAEVSYTLTHHNSLRLGSITIRLNTGRAISGGRPGDRGSYTVVPPPGHRIVGFYGRSGAEVDRLGVLAVA